MSWQRSNWARHYRVGRYVGAFYAGQGVWVGAGGLAWAAGDRHRPGGHGAILESELGYRAAIYALRGEVSR